MLCPLGCVHADVVGPFGCQFAVAACGLARSESLRPTHRYLKGRWILGSVAPVATRNNHSWACLTGCAPLLWLPVWIDQIPPASPLRHYWYPFHIHVSQYSRQEHRQCSNTLAIEGGTGQHRQVVLELLSRPRECRNHSKLDKCMPHSGSTCIPVRPSTTL